jgi:hypothetical protein
MGSAIFGPVDREFLAENLKRPGPPRQQILEPHNRMPEKSQILPCGCSRTDWLKISKVKLACAHHCMPFQFPLTADLHQGRHRVKGLGFSVAQHDGLGDGGTHTTFMHYGT